jgi:hypothetical protein
LRVTRSPELEPNKAGDNSQIPTRDSESYISGVVLLGVGELALGSWL